MTKLNHDRPLLRYLDNIRREMAIDARRTDTLSFGDVQPSVSSVNSDIFPLTPAESIEVSEFFSAIEHYLDIESKVIVGLKAGASKQVKSAAKQVSQHAADTRLKASAVVFSAQMVLSGLENRMNLLNLYKRLEKELREDAKFLWELINDVAMKEAMQKITNVIERHVPANALSDRADR
jgi:hypothetical protein